MPRKRKKQQKQKKQKSSILGIIKSKYARSFIAKNKYAYIAGILILLFVDVVQTQVPIVIGQAIDGIDLQTLQMRDIAIKIVILMVIAVCVFVGRVVWRYFIFGSARKIERDMRNDLFSHLEKMSAKYFQTHTAGDIMAHMTNDLEAVRMTFAQSIMMVLDIIVIGFMTVYNMATHIDPKLTVAAIIPLVFTAIFTSIMGKEMHRRFTKKQEAFSKISDFTQERLSGIKIIKAFVQEEKEVTSFNKVNTYSYKMNMRHVQLDSFMHPFMNMIAGISMAIAIGYGGYITIANQITIGDFSAFLQYLGMLVWPMRSIGMTINRITMGSASMKRIEAILDAPIEIMDEDSADKSITKIGADIKVENLTYHYPDTNTDVLRNINLDVKAGETLGILGRTGSGKTSLVNLFLRVFDPKPGTVFIGGRELTTIPLDVLRHDIGYVPQDNFLFSDTVAANISFGLDFATQEQIEAAAEAACVHDNIVEFPKGYETLVGERGVALSGGQKQRISIARAIIKNPQILILDDSVSAVDTDTEEKILAHLKAARRGKTNIIIAHRISTIAHADKIIVLSGGRIAEQGTHDELVALGGMYADVYQRQLLEKMLKETE